MRYIIILLFAVVININPSIAQSSDIECTVYRRAGAYITLTPAHFDTETLPKVGQQVMLAIYVNDGLPQGKEPGYYDFYLIEVIKLIPETKSITFKATADFEDRKKELGISKLSFGPDSKARISWGE
jgi:hypothetical protein